LGVLFTVVPPIAELLLGSSRNRLSFGLLWFDVLQDLKQRCDVF